MISTHPARNLKQFFRPTRLNSNNAHIYITSLLMQERPQPKAATKQDSAGDEADGGPANQGRAAMRLVHQMHKLASLQASQVNVVLQTLPHLFRRLPHLLRQHGPSEPLRFLHRYVEFLDRCANLLVDRFHCTFQNELVHGYQGDCWITWFEKDIVTGGNFPDKLL